jgi:hypothetical protein
MHTTSDRARRPAPRADDNARALCKSLHHWSSILTAVFVDVIGLSR